MHLISGSLFYRSQVGGVLLPLPALARYLAIVVIIFCMHQSVSEGRGLLTANGARWARSRRLLTPAFHYDILRPYVKVYGEAARELVGLWAKVPEGEPFNAFPFITRLTLDVMLRCSCSCMSNCQRQQDQ